jgi:hypothetical protein
VFAGSLEPLDRAASEMAAAWRSRELTVLFSTVTVLGNGELWDPSWSG